jgi:ADA HAT complex component 1
MLKLQALGENPAPAPKIDTLLLHKRSTDGQWVRLYCAQCGHSNFCNSQGFLNHCRIKHTQVFKSHDQAAIACGVPVDINEPRNPGTATEPSSTAATTPAAIFPVPSTPRFVHPLVLKNSLEPAKSVHRNFTPRDPKKTAPPAPKADFAKAPSTPHLNSLLAKRGFKGDLKGLVDTA